MLRGEPAWTALPDGLPPALVTFLKRCLQKNPAERVRDIGDVRLALGGAFDTIVSHAPGEASQPAPPAARPLWRRALPFAVTALVVAAAALGAGWWLKPAEPGPVIRAAHVLPGTRASGVTFGCPESLPFTLTGGRLSVATRPFDLLPNGRFVGPGEANADQSGATSSEVRLVFNWFEELKRLVPLK